MEEKFIVERFDPFMTKKIESFNNEKWIMMQKDVESIYFVNRFQFKDSKWIDLLERKKLALLF